ncbi:MAG: hypothetical protein ACSLEZ_09350 [Thiobacillus sp.]
MIAMSMTSTYDEYRRDRLASAPVYAVPAHPVRRAMMRALSWIGIGNAAAAADEDILGIG